MSTDHDHTADQCHPYATSIRAGDEVGFHPTPAADTVIRGTVTRVRWEPQFAAPDQILLTVRTDAGTRTVTRDQLVSTPRR